MAAQHGAAQHGAAHKRTQHHQNGGEGQLPLPKRLNAPNTGHSRDKREKKKKRVERKRAGFKKKDKPAEGERRGVLTPARRSVDAQALPPAVTESRQRPAPRTSSPLHGPNNQGLHSFNMALSCGSPFSPSPFLTFSSKTNPG